MRLPPPVCSFRLQEATFVLICTEAKQKKILSQHKVRTSKQDRTLDSMFVPVSQGSKTQSRTSESVNDPPESSNSTRQPQPSTMKEVVIEESECYLTSIRKLRTAIQESKHDGQYCYMSNGYTSQRIIHTEMSEVIQDHVFVGVVDLDRCLSLIQQAKKLYLVNHSALAYDFSPLCTKFRSLIFSHK
jgi:DNA mismatch repair protein MLH1